MELRQLEYFTYICEKKSFIRAAEAAYVSQQAISKSIQALETELGVQLFNRSHREVSLTQYGKILYEGATEVLSIVEETKNKLSIEKAEKQHTLRFAMTDGVEDFINFQKIKGLKKIHPEYNLVSFQMSDREIENQLLSDALDFAICGAIGNNPELDYQELFVHDVILIINANHPLAKKKDITIKDLKNEKFITGAGDYNTFARLLDLCKANGFTPQIGHRTRNNNYVVQLVSDDQGIFLSPSTSIRFFERPEIAIIPIKTEKTLFSICFVTKKNSELSPSILAIRDYYAKMLSEQQ